MYDSRTIIIAYFLTAEQEDTDGSRGAASPCLAVGKAERRSPRI